MADLIDFRPLNVVLRPQSAAMAAYHEAAHAAKAEAEGGPALDAGASSLAAGFKPHPALDLKNHRGRVIADLVFTNRYLGGGAVWPAGDRESIDTALSALLQDPDLQGVIAQYYPGKITSRMLPSVTLDGTVGPKFFKDDVEALVTQLVRDGSLGPADLGNSVICLMLPPDVLLVDGLSTDAGAERKGVSPEHPRHRRPVLVDEDQVDSQHGLGGYHGSVHVGLATAYYAVSVYSQGGNGIDAFDKPWKNVVATQYHELCEARTDPDVEDVIRTGDASKLGWYSQRGGEIGDIPMKLAEPDLSLVMREAVLRNGTTAPMQLQWSNRSHGPEAV